MNQQANHQQNQNKQQQPAEWKPNAHTIFLLQTDDEFTPRARKHIARKWQQGHRDPETGAVKAWHIVTELNPQWLKLNNQIVVLYTDPDKGIFDESKGEWRDRKPGEKNSQGKTIVQPEPSMVLVTKPIDMQPFWRAEGYGEGVDRAALCTEITKRVHPCRAQLTDRRPSGKSNDPQYSISVRAV